MKLKTIFGVFAPMVLLSLCTGTGGCPEPVAVPFNFKKVEAIAPESEFPEQISLRIKLSDTAHWEPYRPLRLGSIGLTRAYGITCVEPIYPIPEESIQSIHVTTLNRISSALPALSNVTGHFYTLTEEFLYVPLERFIENPDLGWVRFHNHIPYNEFRMYLRKRVENSEARFVVSITLSNGTLLTDTTNTIRITQN
jgi:hypothetical protein